MNDGLAEVREALGKGELEGGLEALVGAYALLLSSGSPARGLPVGWGAADALCTEIGASVASGLTEPGGGDWNDVDLFVATQLYAGGGHTAVIGDFVAHSASAEKALLLTGTVERDIYPDGALSSEIIARTGMSSSKVNVCPHHHRLEATAWILERIREIRPRRVFLFHHPEDAVAIAAVQSGYAGAWFLVHHADRKPTSGLHVPGLELVDLSPFTSEFSRLVLELSGRYVPLTLPDQCPGERPPFSLESRGHLVTASSGARHKFGPQYPEVVARTIQATGGRHFHIGYFKKAEREAIAEALSGHGVNPGAFEYVEWVPSLARALWEREVDILIGSIPFGGARTKIEACCAATPMLSFLSPGTPRFGVTHLQPSALPLWQTADELVSLLKAVDIAWLQHHSQLVRRYFVNNHHSDAHCRALVSLDESSPASLCARQASTVDELCDREAVSASMRGEWAWLAGELPGISSSG